jgi:pimeloyl-ACP methyl ester carboxylesterase
MHCPRLVLFCGIAAVSSALLAAETRDIAPPPGGGAGLPTLGGVQFWTDELFFHRWHIQRNVVFGKFRLLDGDQRQHAFGNYDDCRAALQEIKRQRGLPAMHGTVVVTLHGLGRSRQSMAAMVEYLEEQGGYTVLSMGYASTREGIDAHAAALVSVIRNLEGVEQIHFVAHSMGNIVIRRAMQMLAGSEHPRRFGRFVMIGPPNQGAALATMIGDNSFVQAVVGEPCDELGRLWPWVERELAVPPCPFGIIAGGRGNDTGFNPLLPGDDDGVVTVQSTRLAGAADFVLLPVWHSFMPSERAVQEHALRFLRSGQFGSAANSEPAVAR